MKLSETKLPSNKKFGFFFGFVFAIAAAYFYDAASVTLAHTFFALSLAFLLVTLVNADLLLPLNKIWMRFGLLLSMIVSPIILGVIFFGLFTPMAFVMRLSGRDELRLKFRNQPSHWIPRSEPIKPESFKQQF